LASSAIAFYNAFKVITDINSYKVLMREEQESVAKVWAQGLSKRHVIILTFIQGLTTNGKELSSLLDFGDIG
jgi:hypothetical protein